MVRDHDKIVKMLNDLGKCIDLDKQTLKKAFEMFKWELEKHLFTEEKVIFTYYEPEDYEEGYKMVPQLMQEHDKIYKKMKEMKKIIKSYKSCNFQEFKEIIMKHKDFEDKQVYPKLDQELDESTKKMIINRIDEVKLNGTSLRKFKIKCSECGKECEVPFKPTQGKPVYCNECFRKRRRF